MSGPVLEPRDVADALRCALAELRRKEEELERERNAASPRLPKNLRLELGNLLALIRARGDAGRLTGPATRIEAMLRETP